MKTKYSRQVIVGNKCLLFLLNLDSTSMLNKVVFKGPINWNTIAPTPDKGVDFYQ